MKEYARQFYSSAAWRDTRAAYTASVGGLCERCKAKGKLKPAEIVHHKIHLTPENISDPSIALNWSNLEALCRDCHADVHRRVKKRYKIDANGRVTIQNRDGAPL